MSSGFESFEDTEEYQLGNEGEQTVERYLQRNGWATIPKWKYSGEGAPMLEAEGESTVLPDIEASNDGVTRLVEVKTKRETHVQHNQGNQKQHGIDLRHWNHYRDAQQLTGIDVWLFIWEKHTGHLCIASVDFLDDDVVIARRIERGDSGYRAYSSEMIFWPRNQFRIVDVDESPEDGAFGDEKLRGWL